MAQYLVLAELLTVVRGDDDQRMTQHAALRQVAKELADTAVEIAHLAVVQIQEPLHLGGIKMPGVVVAERRCERAVGDSLVQVGIRGVQRGRARRREPGMFSVWRMGVHVLQVQKERGGGLSSSECNVTKLDIGEFVGGEPIAFVLGVGILAKQESSAAYDDASAGINCLRVNGVELAS